MIDELVDRARGLLTRSPPTASLNRDVAFEVLANKRRRLVIRTLVKHDESELPLTRLAEHVAAAENGIERDDLASEERKRVYVSLYQTHVPKMDGLGVIGHDGDDGQVWATETTAAVAATLEDVDERIEREVVA